MRVNKTYTDNQDRIELKTQVTHLGYFSKGYYRLWWISP